MAITNKPNMFAALQEQRKQTQNNILQEIKQETKAPESVNTEKKEPKSSTTTEKTKPVSKEKKEAADEVRGLKMQRTVDEKVKISAVISKDAYDNIEKYMKQYGYKKVTPFLNDLLEGLDNVLQ